MKNEKQEFLEFITTRENPPAALSTLTRQDIALSFKGRSIVLKFVFFQLVGALFSLSFCPQFGLGLMEGHGIAHVFRMMGDWACAAFCGSLFLSSGAIVAFLGMKGEELWWVWRRYRFVLIFLPALLWAGLMLTNITLDLSGETPQYHVAWLIAAVLAQALWLKLRSGVYRLQVQK